MNTQTNLRAQLAQLAVPPVLDEPITAVRFNELWFGHRQRARFGDAFIFEGARQWPAPQRDSFWLSANAEGTHWIRGWHNSDSAEGRALLAANALAGTD